MQDQYEMIKLARATLAANPQAKEVRKSTEADYMRKVTRLFARGKLGGSDTYSDVIAEALKTAKKNTWQASRAALLHTISRALEKELTRQDKMQRELKIQEAAGVTPDLLPWKQTVKRLNTFRQILEETRSAELPLEGRIDRHTKRQDMKGLPIDWRERIARRMPKYSQAVKVAAITGCRPAELVLGVRMSIQDGMLVALIKGAKVDEDGQKGQDWRRLSWPVDQDNEMIRELVKLVQLSSGELMVGIESASNFSKAVSNAAAREWPKRKASITPYCFRHQLAADMKADGNLDGGEISAALGHVSDITKSTYGHANMSRGCSFAPLKVSAARVVRIKAKPRRTAAQKLKLP